MPKTPVPNGALRLVDIGSGCHAFAEGNKDDKKSLNMTVYSGGIIRGHWWWGNLAVDLVGMKFDRSKYPVLENHNTNLKIGFTGKPIVEGSIKLDPKTTHFVNTEESEKFQETSKEGFPYQASMYAIPTSVERIREGEKAEVNGFTIKGPATIWRKAIFQEASVCVFGWDKQTESSVFSKEQKTELEFEEMGGDTETFTHESDFDKPNENGREVKKMPKTVEEMQEKFPELVEKLSTDITTRITVELTAKFDSEKKVFEEKIETLTSENESKESRLTGLERKDLLRSERELKRDADHMVNIKLSTSDIPERLHSKIRKLLNHNKFVKDEVFDEEAFAKVVDDEIKAFEDAGVTSSILGLGTSNEEETPEQLEKEKLDKEDDAAVDEMLKMTGDLPKKDE
jgi:hypothetical protein